MAASTAAPATAPLNLLNQEAGFDCENGTLPVQQLPDKSEPVRRKQCFICGSVATAFCAAMLIGFFICGPLIKHIVPSSKVTNESLGSTALAAAASFMVPVDISLPRLSPRAHQRVRPAKMAAGGAPVLERQRAPPAPPPSRPRGGGGGDGDGDGGRPNHMRLIGAEDQKLILDDWDARTRVYKMTTQFGGDPAIAQRHEAALKEIEELRNFEITEGIEKGTHTLYASDGLKLLFGLYDHDEKIVGLAGMGVNERGLTVKGIAVYPTEVNNVDSTARLRVILALRLVAQTMNVPLDVASLDESMDDSSSSFRDKVAAEKEGADTKDVVVPENIDMDGGAGVEQKMEEKDALADK